MVTVEQLDFLNYSVALKANYRKGADRLKAILQSPTQGKLFASSLGGVSVIFGADPDCPDGNSGLLPRILEASPYADQAVTTWLKDFYDFETPDNLFADVKRCAEMGENKAIMQAVGTSGIMLAKWIATTLGQDCRTYNSVTDVITKNPTVLDNDPMAELLMGNGEALHIILKDARMRGKNITLKHLNATSNYEKVEATMSNGRFFKKSAWRYTTATGGLVYDGKQFFGTTTPGNCVFMCKKTGLFGDCNANQSMSIYELQNNRSFPIVVFDLWSAGDSGGQDDPDPNVGGRALKIAFVGGIKAERHNGSPYLAGYFYCAK